MISVLICTFNRAELLRQTLCALRAGTMPPGCDVEIIVVDNNSRDHTPLVLRQMASEPGIPIRHAVERQQGKSFALNHGLTLARGDVIALTDDDVMPSAEWLAGIVDAFRREPLVFVLGKVLPRWGVLPPPELLMLRARDIWGPLGLVDYGDRPTRYTTARFRTLRLPSAQPWRFGATRWSASAGGARTWAAWPTARCAARTTSCASASSGRGLYESIYDPRITVQHYVPARRVTRRYFRRWFYSGMAERWRGWPTVISSISNWCRCFTSRASHGSSIGKCCGSSGGGSAP
jgi:glucosyl-dolichyl phosphate glucuronosyltransferase